MPGVEEVFRYESPVQPVRTALPVMVRMPLRPQPLRRGHTREPAEEPRAAGGCVCAAEACPNPNGKPGDLYAEVRIMVPSKPTSEEQRLFEQLAKVSTFDPRRQR
jgi:hypothetical protein